ncbi:scavenger receptor class F member 2-like isoform X1 [Gadus macrocephalus]|uniref:scavenger receptor class F member 2-like isoform X1 n=1 Tax=Gadus macrocephalus TaxID=80720 RepID=UPI0028CB409E|nr:scavenger receptor class F member 2-like isoform X1 [Gadus macrocephalus]
MMMETRAVRTALYVACALLCLTRCHGELNPKGRNVCEYIPGHFQCCSGWRHVADECSAAICEGNFTCVENEVCVRPNECRCRHGYFGATCDTKCPAQFWGPDCKGSCPCHPYGRCDDVTGACTCQPDRWGARCQLSCRCRQGTCDQGTGVCTCRPGFWGPQCSEACACSGDSQCDLASGRCHCNAGWYGRACDVHCACSGSPCEQLTGRCQCDERRWGGQCERTCLCFQGRCSQADGSCACRPGFRGKHCREPCPAGSYGQNCRNKCGHCKGQQPCKVTEGLCVTCDRGWNGTRCDEKCANGFFGENCQEVCPACKDGHFCNRMDGTCPHCNPGWIGERCEIKCPNATYGDNCVSECQDCFNGTCHFVTGDCVCDPGFHGAFCNASCSAGQYGVNCNQTCSCYDNDCDPVSGKCNLKRNQRMGLVAAGLLFCLLLLLLLCLLCWGLLRRHVYIDSSHENKAKQSLFGGFTRISYKLPRVPLRRQKLPNVLVSHHDPENTLDCSFIETPSPSTGEQPTPSCSSRGSRYSMETTENSPVCSSPHETAKESKSNAERFNRTETTLLLSEDDELEAQTDHVYEVSPTITEPCLDDPRELTYHTVTKNPPRLGCAPPGGPSLGCSVPPPAQQEGDGATDPLKENTKIIAAGRVKPRPPDPSTKPRGSWIHQSMSPKPKIQADSVPLGTKSTERRTGTGSVPSTVTLSVEEQETLVEQSTSTRSPSGFLPLEPICRAVQSVLRQIRHTDGEPAASKTLSGKHPEGAESNCEVVPPRGMNPQPKNLVLKKNNLESGQESGRSSQPSARNKRKQPSQAGAQVGSMRSSPVLTTRSPHNGDSLPRKADSPGKEGLRNVRKGTPTHPKTTTKKPVQIKNPQEGHIYSKINAN